MIMSVMDSSYAIAGEKKWIKVCGNHFRKVSAIENRIKFSSSSRELFPTFCMGKNPRILTITNAN